MTDPILRETVITDDDGTHRIKARGGLHMIRGNHAPYFSLQLTETVDFRDWRGGADHERVLELWPELADLAALHLSDIDGVPMHAEANGWYWLAGSLGGLGERYHGAGPVSYGSSQQYKTEAECLAIFASHCRITEGEARTIRTMVSEHYVGKEANARARKRWAGLMESMRPRWKREAEAAIERHGLEVYGDAWTREEVRA